VTAQFLWSQPVYQQDASWHHGRAVYCTSPARAHDFELLGRLLCRINDLQERGESNTSAEAAIIARIMYPFEPGRRIDVPAAFCGCDSVFLHDLTWQQEDAGPDFVAGDLNRSLRTLQLRLTGPVVRPAPVGDATRRARARLRTLRARGAVPVTAVRVQANHTLYEPGDNDAPGAVLFNLSPQADMQQMVALAERLFEARDGNLDAGPDLDDAVRMLRENVRHWMYRRRVRLPPHRVGGTEAYVADLWLHRPFLRDQHINRQRGRALPCLAEAGEFGGIELLPFDEEVGPRVRVDPLWLAWNDGCVVKIAQGIADERAFDRLPILADALEDAGCTDSDVLAHCRQPGEHLRNCWVVDLLLAWA
jgi:hypothetical protein